MSKVPLVVVLLLVSANNGHDGTEPLQVLLDAYAIDVAEIRSREISSDERLEHRRNWLHRFVTAISEHPDSPNRRAATAKAIGLANGVGDTELSAALSSQLTDSSTELGDKVFWLIEHGETLLRSYRSGGNDENLNKAIQSLKRSLALVQENKNIIHPDVRSRAVLGGTSLVKALVDSKGISSAEASELLDDLAEISAELPEDVLKRLEATGFGTEGLTVLRLRVAASLGDEQLATMALERLLSLSAKGLLQSHFSSHVLHFAGTQWPEGGQLRREFVLKWAFRATADSWTAFLYFDVVSDAESDGDCGSVIQYGEILLGEAGNALREADKNKKAGSKYMDNVLSMLAACYKAQGKQEKFADVMFRLRSEHPKSDRLRRLDQANSGVAKNKTRLNFTEDTVLLIVNGLALGGVLIYSVASLIIKWRSIQAKCEP